LIDRQGAEFLLGNYPSRANLHCARVADSRKVPFVTASGAAEEIYTQGFQYVFGIMTSAKAFLEDAITLLRKLQHRPETATFLSCDDIAALQDAKTTAVIAKNLGYQLVTPKASDTIVVVDPGVVVYKDQTTDVREHIRAIQSIKPDLFVNTGHLSE